MENGLPTDIASILYHNDPRNTNCTIFTNAVLRAAGIELFPVDKFGNFVKTPESQQIHSAKYGEIRYVVNPIYHGTASQEQILDALKTSGQNALVPGSIIYTKGGERYSGNPDDFFTRGSFAHSSVYMGNGMIAEMSGPSYWSQNNGQYVGEEVLPNPNTGSYDSAFRYDWVPEATDQIDIRSIFDNTVPTETLVKGVTGSPFPDNFVVDRITTEFSIVPNEPITQGNLSNYFAPDTSLRPATLPDSENPCLLNEATENQLLQEYICLPTSP